MRRAEGGVTSGGPNVTRAADWKGALAQLLKDYRFQPIKDIVLWKVNRYVKLSAGALKALNSIAGLHPKSHRNASDALRTLLREPGVDLAMASAFLRFRNPKAFQIIDRHAYRAVYGQKYPSYFASTTAKIDLYFNYLDELFALAESKRVAFELLDRVLYEFDKQVNGKL